MSERISLEELKSYLWGSAVLLRTHIDAGSYKQYIYSLYCFLSDFVMFMMKSTKSHLKNLMVILLMPNLRKITGLSFLKAIIGRMYAKLPKM